MNNKIILFFLFIFLCLQNTAYCNETVANELTYNFYDTTAIPIELNVTKEICTKNIEPNGSKIELKVKNNVYWNNKKIVSKNDIITAKIGTVITSGMNGFPAEVILEDFNIPNVNSTQLMDTYIKKGCNRCFWVYPLKWSLTLIPFVGSLTNLIKGGHAHIKPSDQIVIYYYPEWK